MNNIFRLRYCIEKNDITFPEVIFITHGTKSDKK